MNIINNFKSLLPSKRREQEIAKRAYSRAFNYAKQIMTGTSPLYDRAKYFQGLRYFAGANQGRGRDEWSVSQQNFSSLVNSEWRPLVARSEHLIRTNPYAAQAQRIYSDYVVGGGYRPFPAVKDRNGKLVDSVNKPLEDDWKRFNDEGIRTGNTEMTVSDSMGMVFSDIFADGAILCNRVNSKSGSWLPIAFQFFKPTRLDWSHDTYSISSTTTELTNKTILHGMALNNYGEVDGYFIEGQKNPISSDRMKILFFPRESEQYLAFPWLAPVLPIIYDLDQVLQNRITTMRILESIAFWIKKSSSADLSLGGNEDDEIPIDTGLIMRTKDKPEVVQSEDRVSETFAPLVRLYLHAIGAGLGFSYVLLTRDLANVNFASTRYNYINDNKTFQRIFRWYSKVSYCNHIWKEFVKYEFMTGKIPNYSYSTYSNDPWYYSQVYWLPEGMEWVDPLKDNQALKLAYDGGWMTFQDICALKGKDWRAVLGQHAIEKELMDKLKLTRFITEKEPNAGQMLDDQEDPLNDENGSQQSQTQSGKEGIE